MYELQHEKMEGKRLVKTYLNKQTGSETKITPIYTDGAGVNWWGFVDLFKIPYMRVAMSKHITNTFNVGITKKDLQEWVAKEKELLKSDDPEKYEKLYAMVLAKEQVANLISDPVRGHLAVATVYVLEEGERIDYFTDVEAEAKLQRWLLDPDAARFFLNWHNDHILSFMKRLEKISRTVLGLRK